MKLHNDMTLFRQAVQFTADQMQIPAIYIEKDYWVTYALYHIFNHTIGVDTIFKGGTALSKCYGLIERFSEDIDLVVLRQEGESNNKLNTKLKTITKIVGELLPEIEIAGLTNKKGMNRKTVHTFKKDFTGSYGQVRESIVIEATWLGQSDPHTTKSICSYVGQAMLENEQASIAKKHELMPFEVKVMTPNRTICEKIMSLVRFSYSKDPVEDLKKKIRHIYDLHQLLSRTEYADFFQSNDFEQLLVRVAKDDVISFKNNNQWLQHHPSKSILFKDTENTWTQIKTAYNTDFKNLVYGELPNEDDILDTLLTIQKRLSLIQWNIKPTQQ